MKKQGGFTVYGRQFFLLPSILVEPVNDELTITVLWLCISTSFHFWPKKKIQSKIKYVMDKTHGLFVGFGRYIRTSIRYK